MQQQTQQPKEVCYQLESKVRDNHGHIHNVSIRRKPNSEWTFELSEGAGGWHVSTLTEGTTWHTRDKLAIWGHDWFTVEGLPKALREALRLVKSLETVAKYTIGHVVCVRGRAAREVYPSN